LLPLAGPRREPVTPAPAAAPAGPALKTLLAAAGVTVVLGAGAALWLSRPPARQLHSEPAVVSRNSTTRPLTPEQENKTMTQARLNKAVVFLGVALPALVAAADDQKPLSRDQSIN